VATAKAHEVVSITLRLPLETSAGIKWSTKRTLIPAVQWQKVTHSQAGCRPSTSGQGLGDVVQGELYILNRLYHRYQAWLPRMSTPMVLGIPQMTGGPHRGLECLLIDAMANWEVLASR